MVRNQRTIIIKDKEDAVIQLLTVLAGIQITTLSAKSESAASVWRDEFERVQDAIYFNIYNTGKYE